MHEDLKFESRKYIDATMVEPRDCNSHSPAGVPKKQKNKSEREETNPRKEIQPSERVSAKIGHPHFVDSNLVWKRMGMLYFSWIGPETDAQRWIDKICLISSISWCHLHLMGPAAKRCPNLWLCFSYLFLRAITKMLITKSPIFPVLCMCNARIQHEMKQVTQWRESNGTPCMKIHESLNTFWRDLYHFFSE